MKFLQIVATLMPRELNASTRPFEDMSDDELCSAIATIDRYLAAGAPTLGTGMTYEGEQLLPLVGAPSSARSPGPIMS